MNKLILEILPYIEQVANHTSQDRDRRHEIHQLLILKCYKKKDKVTQLHKDRELLNWLYVVARNINRNLYNQDVYVPLEIDLRQEEATPSPIDNVKTLDKMLEQLDDVERLWMNTYIECNLNKLEMHRRTGIGRPKIDERLKAIFKRWKQLDIFLQ